MHDHPESSRLIIWKTFSMSALNYYREILLSPFSSISSSISLTSSWVGLSTPISLAIWTSTCSNSPRSRQPLPSMSTFRNASSISFFIFFGSFIIVSNFFYFAIAQSNINYQTNTLYIAIQHHIALTSITTLHPYIVGWLNHKSILQVVESAPKAALPGAELPLAFITAGGYYSNLRIVYSMIPAQLKNMFGLKDTKDVNMANNIWKMLDEMSESDPEQYKKFVQKNMKEGLEDVKHQQQQKDKPYKIKPKTAFCLLMSATLNEKPLETPLNQIVLITKGSWSDIRAKFTPLLKISLTVTHTDRVKPALSKSTRKTIQKYSSSTLKDIQLFYYSLQGPLVSKQDKNTYEYCMILNSKFYQDLLQENGGKKLLMSLSISYLQERLSLDKNPLLDQYNPDQYRRLAFYSIEKYSLQISQKLYAYDGYTQPQEFLLEKEIDLKRESELQKQAKQQVKEKPKPEIKFKQQKVEQPELPLVKTTAQPPKKVLIEVLKQDDNDTTNNQISYTMRETEQAIFFEFLLPGVTSIKELDLQMKTDCIRLKLKNKNQLLIPLSKHINEQTIKAKLKKAEGMLRVQAKFS